MQSLKPWIIMLFHRIYIFTQRVISNFCLQAFPLCRFLNLCVKLRNSFIIEKQGMAQLKHLYDKKLYTLFAIVADLFNTAFFAECDER